MSYLKREQIKKQVNNITIADYLSNLKDDIKGDNFASAVFNDDYDAENRAAILK